MTELTVQLSMRAKWWMRPALWAASFALKLGIFRDAPSAEHIGGIITAEERAAKWLADYAFRFSCKEVSK